MGFKGRARARFTRTLRIAITDLLDGSAGAAKAELMHRLRSRPGVPVGGRRLGDTLAWLIADDWVQQAGRRATARFSASTR